MFPWKHFETFNDYINYLMNVRPEQVDEFIKKILDSHFPHYSNVPHNEKTREQTASAYVSNADNKELKQNHNAKQKKEETNEQKEPFEIKVFESHEDVFVHFPVKQKKDLQSGKIYYNSNQLIIKDIPAIGAKHKVLLPSIVQQRGAKIHYKNGILQIKIPKADDMQFTEIDLNF
ncbi:hypothetical protein [Calidifontibacillus erzurumensis]|uniref:hypothetical protein n=1 Tax=Calidifontibacillus erzurumensis TaxID=2741433 RepID=UPI0035B56C75